MQKVILAIRKVIVLRGVGADQVSFHLDAPTSFPELQAQDPQNDYTPSLKVETRAGYGIEWLHQMGVEDALIEVIHTKHGIVK